MNTGSFVFSVKNNSTLLEQALCFTPGNRACYSEVTLSPLGEAQLVTWPALEVPMASSCIPWILSPCTSTGTGNEQLQVHWAEWIRLARCALGVRCPNLPPSLKTHSWVTASPLLRSSTQVNWACGESCDSLKCVMLGAESFLFLWCLFLLTETWLVNQ